MPEHLCQHQGQRYLLGHSRASSNTAQLAKSDMLVDGKRVTISPGMNITAEIKTGQRRIIECLLSAVQLAGSESLRER